MFKHYLNFITIPSVGTIEISEPVGFDGASYKVKQDDKRFGRDIIIANEDTELTFTREFFEELAVEQVLPDGKVINNASLGFDYLIDIFNTDGWEGKVEYILEEDGVLFSTGIFSYATSVVEFDNIKVKIIQNTNREIIKRLEDTDINAFNDTALDGRSITPCATTDILLRAKPIVQNSLWEMTEPKSFNNLTIDYFQPYMNLTSFGIGNSLVPLSDRIDTGTVAIFENFTYINAQTNLTNGTASFRIKAILRYRPNGSSSTETSFTLNIFKYLRPYGSGDPFTTTQVYYKYFSGATNQDFQIDETITIDLPDLLIGECLVVTWSDFGASDVPILNMGMDFQEYSMDFTYTSIAIDTVVKGIRLIDLAKHNTKSLADVDFIAPEYDVNGEHYDNFAFNGLLLGQITDKPFNNKFKDLMNFGDETCSDIQINPTSVELLPYKDYYKDIEMAVFEEIPSFEAQERYNKRYTLKTADFKYKRSSDERATNGQNSIDDVHTETQKFITDTVDSNLRVEINHIRSAFLIEEARRRAFDNEQSKALENDDNLFLLKCIPLAPSTQGGFSAVLLMRVLANGNVEILNNNTDGDGINFNWNLLGFGVGSQFFIDSGENVGTYTVLSITNSVLSLDQVSGTTASFNGDALIKMRWYFTNVAYVNETSETFTLIEGVSNPENYSNLDYCWSRNIKRWYPYLATATKFKLNGIIKTASFKTNGLLRTQKIGETEPLGDSDDIINGIIATEKILTPVVHSVKVYADFAKTTQLINDVQNVKGYVTVRLDNQREVKGFVKEMDATWINDELMLTLEEKYEGDFMLIYSEVLEDDSIGKFVKQIGYQVKNNLASYRVTNIFISLFDNNDVQLLPAVRFTTIKINGVAYTDLVDFTEALTSLINE
jgi:hypothetical protein